MELHFYPALDGRENLRQPLEDGKVTISRAVTSLSFPARFMLAVALNPCPCGYFTDPRHQCTCSPQLIQKYMAKISGPLLDRIDIHVEVPALSYEELAQKTGPGFGHAARAGGGGRQAQLDRFTGEPKIFCNAHMESKHLRSYCKLDENSLGLLKNAIDKLGLSARAFDRITRSRARSPTSMAGRRSSRPISPRRSITGALTESCG